MVEGSAMIRNSVPTHPSVPQLNPLSTKIGLVSDRLRTPTPGHPRIPGKPASVANVPPETAGTPFVSLTIVLPFQSCSVTVETPQSAKSAPSCTPPRPLVSGERRRLITGGGGRLVVVPG